MVTKTKSRPKRRSMPRKGRRVLSDWMVVKVKPKRERYARRMIEQRGGRVFIPFIIEDGHKYEKPLFPGYIFVQGPHWYYLLQTPGVRGPIMMGVKPALMPLREMRRLQRACDKEGLVIVKEERLTPGARVRIKNGAWQGHWGVYITGEQRVRVLLSFLGGQHEFEFARSDVTTLEQKPRDMVLPVGGRGFVKITNQELK